MTDSEEWNALVQDEFGEIISRMMITEWNQVPPNFAVYWSGKPVAQESFGSVLDFAHYTKPFFLKKEAQKSTSEKGDKRKRSSGVKRRVVEKEETLPSKKKPNEIKKDDHEKKSDSRDQPKVEDHPKVPQRRLQVARRGFHIPKGYGGGFTGLFPFANLQRITEKKEGYVGANKADDWRAFARGLNVIGVCGIVTCPYNKNLGAHNLIIRKGYNVPVRLQSGVKFPCPGCNYQPNSFTPTNFLLSEGRASFRNSKDLDGKNVETVVMESPDPFPIFVQFQWPAHRSVPKYSFIEAYACKSNESLNNCFACGDSIGLISDEVKGLNCNHFFHGKCFKLKCPVCTLNNNVNFRKAAQK